jgi:hypothetical protein
MVVFVLVVVHVDRAVRVPVFVRVCVAGAMIVRRLRFMMAMAVGAVCSAVHVIVYGFIILDDDIDLRSGKAASAHLAHLEMSADVKRGRRLFKQGKRHARIDERAEQHVAADA